MTVEDAAGNSDTDLITVIVTDNVDPTAEVGEDMTVETGEEITFDASDSTDNLGIESYQWEFDDGEIGSGKTAEHTFDKSGEYGVKLTVKDESGNINKDTVEITVEKSDGGGSDVDDTPGFTM